MEEIEKCKDLPEQLRKGTLETGLYQFGKYKVRVMPLKPLSTSERVKKYYESNPHLLEERRKRQREAYYDRKKNGLCVKCGSRSLKNHIMCGQCRKKDNERQRHTISAYHEELDRRRVHMGIPWRNHIHWSKHPVMGDTPRIPGDVKMGKAIMVGTDGKAREVDIKLSPKDQAELDAIREQVEKEVAPLYKELGIDRETEDLYWTNGEVFVRNKKTGQRREIVGKTQPELNKRIVDFAKRNK
jgi:hypothetical protein